MPAAAPHELSTPSPWVVRFAPLISPGAPVLDVACGRGRHVRWLAAQGFRVTGVDRDATALAAAALPPPGRSAGPFAAPELLQADIENGPWPLEGRTFRAVVITNYLWRPLLPTLLDSVADGGVLIYETFAAGNESVGKPSRPDFLLQPGELLRWCVAPGWHVVAYEDGFLTAPERFVQRIAAVRLGAPSGASPVRYGLEGEKPPAPRATA